MNDIKDMITSEIINGKGSIDSINNELKHNKKLQTVSFIFESNNKLKTKSRNCRCWKNFLRYAFSHLGLLILFLVFTISGGFLFQLLEKHAAIQKCEEGQGMERNLIRKYSTLLYNFISLNLTDEQRFHASSVYNNINHNNNDQNYSLANSSFEYLQTQEQEIIKKLLEFRDQINTIYQKYKYHGQDCIKDTSWILESAILFSMTLLTTIGYGHVTPITWEGHVVCVCFSMIGIPFFFLCIANLSVTLGDIFRMAYSNIHSFFHKRLCAKSHNKKTFKNFEMQELENIFEKQQTTSTNNLAKIALKNKIKLKDGMINANGNDDDDDDDDKMFWKTYTYFRKNADLDDIHLSNRLRKNLREVRVTVPVSLAILIICFYVFVGSLLFKNLEGWTYVQASYFSFTTMATIGFGDLVPGIKDLSTIHSERGLAGRNLIVAGIYLFFGIAILAMCFDLMQEQLIIKLSNLRNLIIGERDDSDFEESLENSVENLASSNNNNNSNTQEGLSQTDSNFLKLNSDSNYALNSKIESFNRKNTINHYNDSTIENIEKIQKIKQNSNRKNLFKKIKDKKTNSKNNQS